MTGVIVPTLPEAGLLLEGLEESGKETVQGKDFYRGTHKGRGIALSLCGIGKTNAAHAAAILCERFRPARLCVLGVAGAYPDSGLRIGDIALGDREIYGDEGLMAEDMFMTMDAMGMPLAIAGDTEYYNEFPLSVPEGLGALVKTGAFVTVSACSGALRRGLEMGRRFNALCENMEGAAVAHVGVFNNIPVTEIRAISNIVEDRLGRPLDRDALQLAARKAQAFFMQTFPDLWDL
jgi:futalosine hydrolase